MSIKYAVLALIAEQPRHGYAVRTAFEDRLGDFWELNYGQVYQVLAALEAEGLIAGTEEQVGRRPRRTVYAVSPKGRDALRTWMAQPLSASKPFRDDFYVRLVFIAQDYEMLSQLLKARMDACERRVAGLLDQHRTQAQTTPTDMARWLSTEAAIMHADADRKAAYLCSEVLIAKVKSGGGSEHGSAEILRPSENDRARRLRSRV